MNEALLKQLGIDRQILQQLVDERAAIEEAGRLGLRATDAEVRERIVKLPAFQENGHFIGEDRYRQVLRMQRPPLTSAEFESSVRRSIVLDKLRVALTGWITVSDAEVDAEYRKRNEKVKLEIVSFTPAAFREGLEATDAEISAYFEAHKDDFKIGERRKVRYILVDPQKLRERVNISPQDVDRYYNVNADQYATPEQTRASHILLKTEGKDEAAVRKQAETVLARVRAGEDFAALAKQFSEDEASKDKGGDLGFFPRGRMVPEFDQVAFSLQPGIASDLVKTQYGFHIIKVTERRAKTQRSLDEVRQPITEQLKSERAQTMATDLARRLVAQIKTPADFDNAAKASGLTVQETPFFERSEPIGELGPAPDVAGAAFSLETGKVSQAIQTPRGAVILTVTGSQEPRTPALDEVKDKVRDAVLDEKALALAESKARSLAGTLKSAPDFEAAAKAAGLEVLKTPDFVTRGAGLPGIGSSPEVEAAAFSLAPGQVSDVLKTDLATAIIKVVERQDVTPDQLQKGRQEVRESLLNERRGRFFSSYMNKAKERMEITIDNEALSRLVA
jgi:peptidyl-prolyl cis-trans isomerase D